MNFCHLSQNLFLKMPNLFFSRYIILFLAFQIIFIGCEDEITPTLKDAPAFVVVDAWINNKPEPQIIKLNASQSYFDNSPVIGLRGAIIRIIDENSKTYEFIEMQPGVYVWTPQQGTAFGEIGMQYSLTIEYNGEVYHALSKMNRVPPIDSVTFSYEEADIPFPEGYFAEFWSRDPTGSGDTYWIKTFKNGQFLSKPNEINITFDAGFSQGASLDGLVFIQPIRLLINPFEEDENGEFISPYAIGDSVYVEIHSITNEAFYFLNEVLIQTDRPGGFAELFATPLSNVATNITSENSDTEVVGFFNVSAVSSKGKQLEE